MVRLSAFDGDHKKFQIWWMRFKAYATVNKFSEAIGTTGEDDLPASEQAVIDESTPEGKKQLQPRDGMVLLLHICLSMTFSIEVTMHGLVYKAMSTERPGGLVELVVVALMMKCRPQDTITMWSYVKG